jgi:hypothetical protein
VVINDTHSVLSDVFNWLEPSILEPRATFETEKKTAMDRLSQYPRSLCALKLVFVHDKEASVGSYGR